MAGNLIESVDDIGDEIGLRVDQPQSYTDLVAVLLDRNGRPHAWCEASQYTEMASDGEVPRCACHTGDKG